MGSYRGVFWHDALFTDLNCSLLMILLSSVLSSDYRFLFSWYLLHYFTRKLKSLPTDIHFQFSISFPFFKTCHYIYHDSIFQYLHFINASAMIAGVDDPDPEKLKLVKNRLSLPIHTFSSVSTALWGQWFVIFCCCCCYFVLFFLFVVVREKSVS